MGSEMCIRDSVDGVLVGGASLDVGAFTEICREVAVVGQEG